MEPEEEIKKFLARYRSSVKYFTVPVSKTKCAELLKFDDFYRDLSKVHFSPFLNPLLEYQNHERGYPANFGGTGASYATSLLRLAALKLDYNLCKKTVLGKKVETANSMLHCLSKFSAEHLLISY
jgi:hypothetical protein